MRHIAAENESKSGKRPAMYHVIANSYLEFVGKDHAHLAGAGREVDAIVRINGQWLIKTRDVAPTD
jgi:hypothetical protein